MAKSAKDAGLTVNGTVKEMMELQMKGGLISEKVLPHFAKNMSAAARANGGLEKAMLSNRVAMNRLMFSFQEAGNIIFKSGFGDGLTELFNAMAESVVKLKPLWEALGKIIGSVFRLIAKGVKWVTPMFISMGEVLNSITSQIGSGREYLLAMVGPAAWIGRAFGGWATKLIPAVAAITSLLTIMKEIAFWAEEIDNLLFSKNKIGVLYDPRTGVNGNALIDYLTPFASPETINKQVKSFNPNSTDSSRVQGWFKSQRNFGGSVPQSILDGVNRGQPIQIIIGADADKMGITVSQASAVQDMVDSKIKMVQN